MISIIIIIIIINIGIIMISIIMRRASNERNYNPPATSDKPTSDDRRSPIDHRPCRQLLFEAQKKQENTSGYSLQPNQSGFVRGELGWAYLAHILPGEGVPATERSRRLLADLLP